MNMKFRPIYLALTLLLLLTGNAFAEKKVVLVFYSDIGGGHLSAAKRVKEATLEKTDDVEIIFKNIRDFENPLTKDITEKVYWWLVENWPSKFTQMYKAMMEEGNQLSSVERRGHSYSEIQLAAYINEMKPDIVLSAHYGSALNVGSLVLKRMFDEETLKKIKIGWINTDYIDGYFHRVAQLGTTFLPHAAIGDMYEKQGVPKEHLKVTGMPITGAVWEPFSDDDRREFMKEIRLDPKNPEETPIKLDPEVETITLASGLMGVGDFPTIVKSLANKWSSEDKKLQVVAVTGLNSGHYNALTNTQFPEGIKVVTTKKIPVELLMKFEKSSDAFISKSGGLSPTEGFAIGRPILLLNVYGGHERENAELFEKLNLSVIVEGEQQKDIGDMAWDLLRDKEKKEKMAKAQAEFKEMFDIGTIVDWIISDEDHGVNVLPERLGEQGGPSIMESGSKALAQMDKMAPSDMEIIMPYVHTHGDNYKATTAIRVGDEVTIFDRSRNKVSQVPYTEYLLGTEDGDRQQYKEQGILYKQNAMGLKLDGMGEIRQNLVKKAVSKAGEGTGQCDKKFRDIMNAAGLKVSCDSADPMTTIKKTLRKAQESENINPEIVLYAGVSETLDKKSETELKYGFAPNKKDVGHLFKTWIGGNPTANDLEEMVSTRLAFYPGARPVAEDKRPMPFRVSSSTIASEKLSNQKEVERLEKKEEDLERDIDQGRSLADVAKAMDELYLEKLKLVMDRYMTMTKEVLGKLKGYARIKEMNQFNEKFSELEKLREEYGRQESLYNKARDYKRMGTFRKFVNKTADLMKDVHKIVSKGKSRRKRSQGSVGFIDQVAGYSKIISAVSSMLVKLSPLGTIEEGETPFAKKMKDMGQSFAVLSGTEVDIQGRENLEKTPEQEQVLTIYAPTHRDPHRDLMLTGNYAPDVHMGMAAVDLVLPKALADRADKDALGIIAVRKGKRDYVDDMQKAWNQGVKDLIVYPSGATEDTGIGHTLPVRENFSEKVVHELIKRGINVRIIPISYKMTSRLAGNQPSDDTNKVTAVITKPIEQDQVKKLVADKNLGETLRSIWLSKQDTNQQELLGQRKIRSIIEKMDEIASSPDKLAKRKTPCNIGE